VPHRPIWPFGSPPYAAPSQHANSTPSRSASPVLPERSTLLLTLPWFRNLRGSKVPSKVGADAYYKAATRHDSNAGPCFFAAGLRANRFNLIGNRMSRQSNQIVPYTKGIPCLWANFCLGREQLATGVVTHSKNSFLFRTPTLSHTLPATITYNRPHFSSIPASAGLPPSRGTAPFFQWPR